MVCKKNDNIMIRPKIGGAMGRNPNKHYMLGIYISGTDREDLRAMAESKDRSMSSCVRIILRREIKRWRLEKKHANKTNSFDNCEL